MIWLSQYRLIFDLDILHAELRLLEQELGLTTNRLGGAEVGLYPLSANSISYWLNTSNHYLMLKLRWYIQMFTIFGKEGYFDAFTENLILGDDFNGM